MAKPYFVVLSDNHYTLKNLELSDRAFRAAIDKAAELNVPCIDAGDITDSKRILDSEVVRSIIETLQYAKSKNVKVFALVGNHSLVHEKSKEHALHFMNAYCTVVEEPGTYGGFNFIPYQTNGDDFIEAIKAFPKGSIVIGHQGTIGGVLGHYIQDPSGIDPELVKEWTVFLGHLHKHYTLVNTISIGSTYTHTFGESGDGDKGFLVVYDDGSFEQVVLPFRKHVILELEAAAVLEDAKVYPANPDDLLWVKIVGSASELASVKLDGSFKIEKIVTDAPALTIETSDLSGEEILDALIDNEEDSEDTKDALKALWREVLS